MQPNNGRVVLQSLQDSVVVPFPDPLQQDFLDELRHRLLQHLHQKPLRGIVLDLSSVELLDSTDFMQIEHLWQSVRLMGCPLVLAGMQPGVAAALAMLNAKDSWVLSTLSVETALKKLSTCLLRNA